MSGETLIGFLNLINETDKEEIALPNGSLSFEDGDDWLIKDENNTIVPLSTSIWLAEDKKGGFSYKTEDLEIFYRPGFNETWKVSFINYKEDDDAYFVSLIPGNIEVTRL